MKVKTLIKKLEKMDPEAEVRLHDKSGEPVLFVLCAKKYPDVWLQTEGDVDMSDEIQARFDDAIENGTDELDVYMEMDSEGKISNWGYSGIKDRESALQRFHEYHEMDPDKYARAIIRDNMTRKEKTYA